jgi:hypothetical protein
MKASAGFSVAVLVRSCGNDANLWREFGIATNAGRGHVDGNVRAFQAFGIDATYVLATDGNLRQAWPAPPPADARNGGKSSI